MSKCEARLPSTSLPNQLYFCNIGDESPSSVYVTTDNERNIRIRAISSKTREPTLDPSLLSQALTLAKQNIPMVQIIKKDGVPKKAVYTCPVSMSRSSKRTLSLSPGSPSNEIVGVLVGIDTPSSDSDEKSISDMVSLASPEDAQSPDTSLVSKLISSA